MECLCPVWNNLPLYSNSSCEEAFPNIRPVLLYPILLAVGPPVMQTAHNINVRASLNQALSLPDCTDACIADKLNLQTPRQAIDLHLFDESHRGQIHDACTVCSVRTAQHSK